MLPTAHSNGGAIALLFAKQGAVIELIFQQGRTEHS